MENTTQKYNTFIQHEKRNTENITQKIQHQKTEIFE